jgi:type III pantothenate kinase
VPPFPLIAVDIGNSRTKLGFFSAPILAGALPTPAATLELVGSNWPSDALAEWLATISAAASSAAMWHVASVNRVALQHFDAVIAGCCPKTERKLISFADLPLEIRVPNPNRVGIDRLLGAVAANHVRQKARAAVVIHVGTAITANLVTPDGAFAGGAILPGIALSARALHEHTDLLPRIDMVDLAEPPPVIGTSTEPAIESGLFWGAVGAMRELAHRLVTNGDETADDAEILLTGGAAPNVAQLLGPNVRHEPHLVLCGIAVAAIKGSGVFFSS